MTIAISGTNGITLDGQFNSASSMGFKNRLINSAMVIDQRNAGASVTPATGAYTLDRWAVEMSQASKFSVQQNAGSVTPPTGFKNYLGATSLSAYTVGASEYFVIGQAIEGYNVADLAFGTADAATVTLSFWVRSSLTGTFGGTVLNSGASRNYVFSYTINAANTWEQKTVTITGDTSGTWLTTNGAGLFVRFSIGAGSSVTGTAGSWSGTTYRSVTGQTSVVGTNGATFYITGVQLEKGSTATSFDYRPYGTELALCQRYYQSINFSEAQGVYTKFGNGVAISTTQARTNTFLLVKMRTYPSLVVTSTASNYGVSVTSDIACSAVPTINSNTNPSIATIESTVASGLTAGNAVIAQANNNQTAYVGFNAEL
jgi:hypothetical protein